MSTVFRPNSLFVFLRPLRSAPFDALPAREGFDRHPGSFTIKQLVHRTHLLKSGFHNQTTVTDFQSPLNILRLCDTPQILQMKKATAITAAARISLL